MAQMANMALDGGDPRLTGVDDSKELYGLASNATLPQARKLHDSSITFEEYYYYAEKTRAEEDAMQAGPTSGIMSLIFPSKSDPGVTKAAEKRGSVIAETVNLSRKEKRMEISDEEWTNANRALRTASWGAIFYLITTDILGPFALPYAFGATGYGSVEVHAAFMPC